MQQGLFDLGTKYRLWQVSLAYHLSLGIIDIDLHQRSPLASIAAVSC
jgi:hypothetical protein